MNELKRPFAPDDISWLPGATTKDGAKVQAMAYADLRAYMDRLDEVCGDDWQVAYAPWGERIICNLTIHGITRSSTGEMDNQSQKREIGGTVAEAQAFKRACAMFGLGRYLYNLPSVWVEYDAQRKQITDKARAELEQRYRTWYAKASQTRTDAPGRATPNHAATAPKAPQRPAAPATAHIDDAPPVDENGPENLFETAVPTEREAAILNKWQSPEDAIAWATRIGGSKNEYEARNAYKKVLRDQFGNVETDANRSAVWLAYMRHEGQKWQAKQQAQQPQPEAA